MAAHASKILGNSGKVSLIENQDQEIEGQFLLTIKAKVAVVIPVFNSENQIKSCLQSLFAQTYKNFEIFAVDDGSTDKSLEVLREYSALLPIRIQHQDNKGQAVARNAALDSIISTGSFQYISFVDADDRVPPPLPRKTRLLRRKTQCRCDRVRVRKAL